MEILMVIVSVLVLIGIIVGIVMFTKKRKKSRGQCKKCNTPFTANDVEYQSMGVESKMVKCGNQQHREDTEEVQFRCICPKCGNEYVYTKKFLIYSNGRSYNINQLVDTYMRKTYGR